MRVAAQLSPIRFSLDHQSLVRGRMAVFWNATRQSDPRKLAQLDAAQTLAFLRPPPGNRLEALKNAKRIAREVSPAAA